MAIVRPSTRYDHVSAPAHVVSSRLRVGSPVDEARPPLAHSEGTNGVVAYRSFFGGTST